MYIDIITNCFYSILSGLIIYFILIGIKQNWVNTIYYLITFMLLPPVAFVSQRLELVAAQEQLPVDFQAQWVKGARRRCSRSKPDR